MSLHKALAPSPPRLLLSLVCLVLSMTLACASPTPQASIEASNDSDADGPAADAPAADAPEGGEEELAAATAQAGDVTCSGSGDSFTPVRISDGRTLGTPVPFEHCLDAIRASNEGVVCGHQRSNQYLVIRIEDGFPVGSQTHFDNCLVVTGAARNGIVCAPNGNGFSQTRIADLRAISPPMQLEQCVAL